MSQFVIEVYRPGLTPGSATEISEAVKRTVAADPAGSAVRYVGCTLAPRDEVCYVRVESSSKGAVEALVDRLSWSDVRVSEIVDLA